MYGVSKMRFKDFEVRPTQPEKMMTEISNMRLSSGTPPEAPVSLSAFLRAMAKKTGSSAVSE